MSGIFRIQIIYLFSPSCQLLYRVLYKFYINNIPSLVRSFVYDRTLSGRTRNFFWCSSIIFDNEFSRLNLSVKRSRNKVLSLDTIFFFFFFFFFFFQGFHIIGINIKTRLNDYLFYWVFKQRVSWFDYTRFSQWIKD